MAAGGWRRPEGVSRVIPAVVLVAVVLCAGCRSSTVVRTKQSPPGVETTLAITRDAVLLPGDPRPLESVKQTAPTVRSAGVVATPHPTSTASTAVLSTAQAVITTAPPPATTATTAAATTTTTAAAVTTTTTASTTSTTASTSTTSTTVPLTTTTTKPPTTTTTTAPSTTSTTRR